MQITDLDNSYYELQVNDDNCFQVGGEALDVNSWQWVNTQVDNQGEIVSFDFASLSGNSLKLVGTKPGVKIDRLLLTKTDCVPVDLGSNCSSDQSSLEVGSGANEIPPISTSPVSGKIIPTPTITAERAEIEKVTYFVGSLEVPAGDDFSLDTTLLNNGEQRITIKIVKIDGTIVDEATTLTIGNPEDGFSSLWRWARLNKAMLYTGLAIIFALTITTAIWSVVKKTHQKKKHLKFRGF